MGSQLEHLDLTDINTSHFMEMIYTSPENLINDHIRIWRNIHGIILKYKGRCDVNTACLNLARALVPNISRSYDDPIGVLNDITDCPHGTIDEKRTRAYNNSEYPNWFTDGKRINELLNDLERLAKKLINEDDEYQDNLLTEETWKKHLLKRMNKYEINQERLTQQVGEGFADVGHKLNSMADDDGVIRDGVTRLLDRQ